MGDLPHGFFPFFPAHGPAAHIFFLVFWRFEPAKGRTASSPASQGALLGGVQRRGAWTPWSLVPDAWKCPHGQFFFREVWGGPPWRVASGPLGIPVRQPPPRFRPGSTFHIFSPTHPDLTMYFAWIFFLFPLTRFDSRVGPSRRVTCPPPGQSTPPKFFLRPTCFGSLHGCEGAPPGWMQSDAGPHYEPHRPPPPAVAFLRRFHACALPRHGVLTPLGLATPFIFFLPLPFCAKVSFFLMTQVVQIASKLCGAPPGRRLSGAGPHFGPHLPPPPGRPEGRGRAMAGPLEGIPRSAAPVTAGCHVAWHVRRLAPQFVVFAPFSCLRARWAAILFVVADVAPLARSPVETAYRSYIFLVPGTRRQNTVWALRVPSIPMRPLPFCAGPSRSLFWLPGEAF